MKKEFKNFFSKKYILIILPILIALTIFLWYESNLPDDKYTDFIFRESAYSNFIDVIKPYDTQEELIRNYERLISGSLPGISADNKAEKYTKLLYEFSIKKQLPYDSLVEFSEEAKYTQFHYLSKFNTPIIIFILLASLLIGGFYQTSDIMSKMSKLVYSSGEKRSKIIDRKYGASLLIMMGIVAIFDCIVALLGLMYCSSGAKYCVVYLGGETLYHLNYFQCFCLYLTNHIVALVVTYTFVYYLSVICKNGIIPVCIGLSALIIYFNLPYSQFLDMIANDGFINVLYTRDISCAVNLSDLCLYIPIMVLSIIPLVISRFTIKRADYSR